MHCRSYAAVLMHLPALTLALLYIVLCTMMHSSGSLCNDVLDALTRDTMLDQTDVQLQDLMQFLCKYVYHCLDEVILSTFGS